jgi:hypothetical protein
MSKSQDRRIAEQTRETITIFKSGNGEVWRDGENYGSLNAGHELCRDMAMEIERLRIDKDSDSTIKRNLWEWKESLEKEIERLREYEEKRT